jgi:hypothetical protein
MLSRNWGDALWRWKFVGRMIASRFLGREFGEIWNGGCEWGLKKRSESEMELSWQPNEILCNSAWIEILAEHGMRSGVQTELKVIAKEEHHDGKQIDQRSPKIETPRICLWLDPLGLRSLSETRERGFHTKDWPNRNFLSYSAMSPKIQWNIHIWATCMSLKSEGVAGWNGCDRRKSWNSFRELEGWIRFCAHVNKGPYF